jgi:hypothetical protein
VWLTLLGRHSHRCLPVIAASMFHNSGIEIWSVLKCPKRGRVLGEQKTLGKSCCIATRSPRQLPLVTFTAWANCVERAGTKLLGSVPTKTGSAG